MLFWLESHHLEDLACTSHAVSPRPGLVKLLALFNFPAFVHVTRVSQDFVASVVCCYVILCVIGASFSLIECASCHRYLEPNGFSALILLCTIDDLTLERLSSWHQSVDLFLGGEGQQYGNMEEAASVAGTPAARFNCCR